MVMMKALIVTIAGEFGIVYRARLTRSTLRKAECEIVAVKTIKGKLNGTPAAVAIASTSNLNILTFSFTHAFYLVTT